MRFYNTDLRITVRVFCPSTDVNIGNFFPKMLKMEIFENDRVNCKNRIFIIFDFDYENEFSVELSIKLYYTILQSSEKNVGMQMKLRVIFSSQVINFIEKS